jgi:hypothetical protein
LWAPGPHVILARIVGAPVTRSRSVEKDARYSLVPAGQKTSGAENPPPSETRAEPAKRRPGTVPRWEGDIGDTPRHWFRWVLRFAQTPPAPEVAARRRNLATFALLFLGIAPWRAESPSERRLRQAREQYAQLEDRRRKAEEARDEVSEAWAAVLVDRIGGQKDMLRALSRQRRADTQQPTEAEMRDTTRALLRVLTRLMKRQPVTYHIPTRIVRWNPMARTFTRDRVAELGGRPAAKAVVRDGRFTIHHAGTWNDFATAHLCELVARFGHEVRTCPGEGPGHVQWFLPARADQTFCLAGCALRARVARFRRRDRTRR